MGKERYSAYCLKCGAGHNKLTGICLVPNCNGLMGTEGQLIKKERTKCNHIFGYDEKSLVYQNQYKRRDLLSIFFNYCPMCGQRFKPKKRDYENKRVD